ncbi:hypothetical protein B0F90DRAFT_1678440 [Multifurca ochricompacta]|uniref:Glucose receptor Git3 N-terminal domain-containing protein n=1 Tax=Multifurca ochricompacta TaxID=376703 RepID=A0AAD4QU01_9AGAM|nr:hypothetical protein B0F90DRAFT_1678440 [Multifurca ochricompacta]
MSTANNLPFGQRIGVFILAEISAVSASAISILLGYIAYSTVSIRSGSKRRWRLESPVHLFLLNQLVCDLIQALGGLMNMKWVADGTVHSGPFCTAQGLIKQLADVGTALSAGNVAIYTFSALIFRLKPDTNVSRAVLVVAGIWVSIVLNVAINVGINGASRFYGPTGPWCWIMEEFSVQRTVADFMWMWISAFSSLLAYIAVFLVLRGFIAVEGWHVRWTYGQESQGIPQSHLLAYKMLAYPIIYIVTVLPLAAARYNDFAGHHTPFAVIVIADGFYLSSGLLNVLLYTYTRPFLLPYSSDSPDDQSIAIHSEFAPSRNDLSASIVLDNIHVFDSEPIEPKSADPAYVAPEMAHPLDMALSTKRYAGRDDEHEYESSGDTLVRGGLPTVNIYDEL